jgi:hypothetical protein
MIIVIRPPPILYYISELEDIQRYINTGDEVQLQVEDSGFAPFESDVLEQSFCLNIGDSASRVGSERGEISVWIGGTEFK